MNKEVWEIIQHLKDQIRRRELHGQTFSCGLEFEDAKKLVDFCEKLMDSYS